MTAFYDAYSESLLDSSAPDLTTVNVAATLVNTTTDYTVDLVNHEFFSSVTDYLAVTPVNLTGKSITDGVFDSTLDVVFSSVAIDGSKDVDAIVIFYDTGTPATSPLIAYYDQFTPVTPNGGDITIQFNGSGLFDVS